MLCYVVIICKCLIINVIIVLGNNKHFAFCRIDFIVETVEHCFIYLLNKIYFFQCGFKGHYANKCPKGHLAFLSLQQNQALQNNQGA